ncbi:uncharacterized protein LOC119077004 [Bradysia coprophila]|uniref:uncharacterized protein LOC119077004 n=1 Tax=Bradysia coprophila TaxID=38358 RepID=UPI00187DA1B5|nr:uncharacterized protein LOC119077004 [Bradysia coprophila]
MKYILRKFWCNSNLQTAVFIYGVLTSVFSGILLITTLSTDMFKECRYSYKETYNNVRLYYDCTAETTPVYWVMVDLSIVHMITSIFLTIGVEKKNVFMIMPWLVVQAITFMPLIPIIVGVLLCFAIVSFPVYIWWAALSILMTLRSEVRQDTGRSPSSVAATAPSAIAVYSNTFEDVQLPAYKDVVPDGATKYNV